MIAGGVGEVLQSLPSNVHITGQIDEKTKQDWLTAVDIGINPMFSGSGTNIKMLEYMVNRLATVTTTIGARGIEPREHMPFLEVEPTMAAFIKAIDDLRDPATRNKIGEEARICVENGYAWEQLSALMGTMCRARHHYIGQPLPQFSVIVPTYERHDHLDALMSCLQNQIERDFEVIVVDQSNEKWAGRDLAYGFPLLYFHTPIKGAVRARNTGATLAQGKILAFTDDDCLPRETWLLNAQPYFLERGIVGLEGTITSDHLNEPEWRPVTNVGFKGIGFMTANLIVRAECFRLLGGFDLAFDNPHFREDTDFGWRLLSLGEIPYAVNVEVFHPAQPRSIERESAGIRNLFFRKDALLYKKHPDKYRELFFAESHYRKTKDFSNQLLAGFKEYNIDIPDWMRNHLQSTP